MTSWLNRYRVEDEPLRSERRAELLLLVVAALLLIELVYSGFRLATLPAPAAIPPAAGSLDVAAVAEPADVNESESEAIKTRPLFWRGRRPVEASAAVVATPVAEESATKSGNIDKVKLKGVFGSGDSAGIIALVDGRKRRIRVGDTVEGWTLVAVKPDRGLFENDGRKSTLVLKRVPAAAKLAASESK